MTYLEMNWLFDTSRSNPEIAIFLALAFGFYIGGLAFGKFRLGDVTGALRAGGFNRRSKIVWRLTNATLPDTDVHTFTIEAEP